MDCCRRHSRQAAFVPELLRYQQGNLRGRRAICLCLRHVSFSEYQQTRLQAQHDCLGWRDQVELLPVQDHLGTEHRSMVGHPLIKRHKLLLTMSSILFTTSLVLLPTLWYKNKKANAPKSVEA